MRISQHQLANIKIAVPATVTSVLLALGALSAARLTLRISSVTWRYFLRPSPDLAKQYCSGAGNKDDDGSPSPSPSLLLLWAVVTGGTSGIGLEIARRLAQQGFCIMLVARNAERLDHVAKEIGQEHGVEVAWHSLDASTCGPIEMQDFVNDLENKLRTRAGSLGMLVNNVGVHNRRPVSVKDMDPDEVDRIITVNCSFTVRITAALLPFLKRHAASSPNTRSAILNVSSLTSTSPMPMLAVYAATKAFCDQWSRCLACEVEPWRIDVRCVRPGLTCTPMQGNNDDDDASPLTVPEPSLFMPPATRMAHLCLNTFASSSWYSSFHISVPYFPHAVLFWCGLVLPEWLQWKTARQMNNDNDTEQTEMDTFNANAGPQLHLHKSSILETSSDPDKVEEVDVDPNTLEVVMSQTGCSREKATHALIETKGDMVNSILLLSS